MFRVVGKGIWLAGPGVLMGAYFMRPQMAGAEFLGLCLITGALMIVGTVMHLDLNFG